MRTCGILVVGVLAARIGGEPRVALGQATAPAPADVAPGEAEPAPVVPEHPVSITRQIPIAAVQDRLWAALTEKQYLDHWFPFKLVDAELKEGGKFVFGSQDRPQMTWTVQQIAPKQRLSVHMRFIEGPEALVTESPTRVTFELMSWGPTTTLMFTHDELELAPRTAMGSGSVWDSALSQLKTLLETGRPMAFSWEQAKEQESLEGVPQPPKTANPLAFVQQITLIVADMKTVRPWYEETFALPLSGFSQRWIQLSMATPQISVREPKPESDEKPGQVELTYNVLDVEAFYRRLEKQGVEFAQKLTSDERTREFTFLGPGGHRFYVRGPTTPPATRPAEEPEAR